MKKIYSYLLAFIIPIIIFIGITIFNKDNTHLIINSIKIGLLGLTTYSYLKNKKINKPVILSIFISLFIYIISYYTKINLLNSFILLPILFLSIDKIFKNRNTIIYSIILFTITCMNYYISYIIFIIVLLYIIYKLFINKENNLKFFIKIGLSSFLSIFLALLILSSTVLNLNYLPKITLYNTNLSLDIITLFSKFLINNSIFSLTNIYFYYIVIIISLILFIIYNIFEEKITNLIVSIYKKYEEIINYLIIGVLTTLVSIITYALFTKLLNINYIISTILSWIASVIFAYITNKLFVFKSKSKEKNVILKEIYEFLKYRLLSLGIEVVLMYLLVSLLTMNDMISKVIVQIIIIILNYVFSKLFVFKK